MLVHIPPYTHTTATARDERAVGTVNITAWPYSHRQKAPQAAAFKPPRYPLCKGRLAPSLTRDELPTALDTRHVPLHALLLLVLFLLPEEQLLGATPPLALHNPVGAAQADVIPHAMPLQELATPSDTGHHICRGPHLRLRWAWDSKMQTNTPTRKCAIGNGSG